MNLIVYRDGSMPSDQYLDVYQDFDFRFDVANDGILRIYKVYEGNRHDELVVTYPKGQWIKVLDSSLLP